MQSSSLIFSAICFDYMFIAFSRCFVDFLYVFIMFSCNSRLQSLGGILCRFAVLSANTYIFGDDLIFKISCLIIDWKLSWTFLNFNDLIMSSKSFSKHCISVVCAGCQLDLKPKDYLVVSFLFFPFKKKNAFYLIRLITLSILSISFNWYDDLDGVGIFFSE